jgi:predicted ribosomally synthesized peptide with SipW-like signal peptide
MLNRKIFMSILVIAVVAAMVGMNTFAYFSDSETSKGNTFTAGTLDLQVNGQNGPLPILVNIEAKPSQRIVKKIKVKNVGINKGVLDIHYTNVVDSGNLNPEPEQEYERVFGPRDDISNALFVDIEVDYNNDGVIDQVLIPDLTVTLGALKSKTLDFPVPIPAGAEWDIYLSFHLCPNVGNWGQGDKTTFDIEFTLHQLNAPHTTHVGLPLGGTSPTGLLVPVVPGTEMTVHPRGQSQFDVWTRNMGLYVDSFFDIFTEINFEAAATNLNSSRSN